MTNGEKGGGGLRVCHNGNGESKHIVGWEVGYERGIFRLYNSVEEL